MKDLASQTGIELPKDQHDNKKLSYKREAKKPTPIAQPKPTAKDQNEISATQAATNELALDATSIDFDPFAEFQSVEYANSEFQNSAPKTVPTRLQALSNGTACRKLLHKKATYTTC